MLIYGYRRGCTRIASGIPWGCALISGGMGDIGKSHGQQESDMKWNMKDHRVEGFKKGAGTAEWFRMNGCEVYQSSPDSVKASIPWSVGLFKFCHANAVEPN